MTTKSSNLIQVVTLVTSDGDALIAIFSDPLLKESLAFRGGTALYKLHLKPAARYSEDIDLVQVKAEPAGPTMDALRGVLDPWQTAMEADRGPSHLQLPLLFRKRAAVSPKAQSRDQFAGALCAIWF